MSDHSEIISQNAEVIRNDLSWLRQVAMARNRSGTVVLSSLEGPADSLLVNDHSPYASLTNSLEDNDRLLLILALCPHILHTLTEEILLAASVGTTGRNSNYVAATGLVQGAQFQGYLPTALTFLYLAAGDSVTERLRLMQWLGEGESQILKEEKVILAPPKPLEPIFSGVLYMPPPVITELLMIRTQTLYGHVRETL